MTQQFEEIVQPVEATAQQFGVIAQQAEVKEPLQGSADSTVLFAASSQFSDPGEGTPASSDPFASDTKSSEFSQPIPVNDAERRKADDGGFDPLSSSESSRSESVDGFDSGSGNDGVEGERFRSEPTQPPLRIIRFRNVRANDVRSVVLGIFNEEADKQRWFLTTENQSNSLICKVPADKFEQIKRLAEGLDGLAATGVDVGKKTQSWPIPHVFNDGPDGGEETDSHQWQIRIVRLQFVRANDFASIARDLARRQNANSQLQLDSEPTTNSVVMRGPLAEINQVEQLAQQLDQSSAGAVASADAVSPFASPQASTSEVFDFAWKALQPPTDQARQLREQVRRIDERSVALAREVRDLQKNHSSQHPSLKAVRGDLLTLLEEAFEKRLQLQGIEVALLNNRLREIESRVQQRAQLRQQIIDRRLHELLGENDDLSWEVVQTGPVLPSGSPIDVLHPPGSSPDNSRAKSVDFVKNSPYRDDTSVPPTPYTGEITNVPTGIEAKLPQQRKTVSLLGDAPATHFPAQPEPAAAFGVVDRVLPGELLENPQAQNPLTFPSRNEGATWQQELIVAENTVETAGVKVDQVKSRLSKIKNPDQAEHLEYELQLAELALDQARKLLDQKHRWIEAQRNSLRVNIQYLEKSLEAAKAEYEIMIQANKKVPGTVPEVELRRTSLEIEKAELRLKQAVADLAVFEVENRTSRTSGATRPTNQTPTWGPAAKNKPAVAEPRFNSGIDIIDGPINEGVPIKKEPSSPDSEVQETPVGSSGTSF